MDFKIHIPFRPSDAEWHPTKTGAAIQKVEVPMTAFLESNKPSGLANALGCLLTIKEQRLSVTRSPFMRTTLRHEILSIQYRINGLTSRSPCV